jgi:hypothetical protein
MVPRSRRSLVADRKFWAGGLVSFSEPEETKSVGKLRENSSLIQAYWESSGAHSYFLRDLVANYIAIEKDLICFTLRCNKKVTNFF